MKPNVMKPNVTKTVVTSPDHWPSKIYAYTHCPYVPPKA